MTEQPNLPAAPEIKVTEDNFSIDALREISVAESQAEEQTLETTEEKEGDSDEAPAPKKESKPEKQRVDIPPAKDDDDGEEEEATEESIDTEDTSEKEGGDISEKFLEASKGDKKLKIPLDAKITVKVDGKEQSLTVQQLRDKVSGVLHVEKEVHRLGRDRKKFEEERGKFEAETQAINTNIQALLEMQDPFEFCAYYGNLKGIDPQKVFEDMVKKTTEHIERFASMTEAERRLEAENRRLKIFQKHTESKQKKAQEKEKQQQARAALERELKSEGLTMEDFQESLAEMQEKVAKNESLGEDFDDIETITASDVVDYAASKSLAQRVNSAVESVNKSLVEDSQFIGRLKKALHSTERLHGKLSEKELKQFVKAALDAEKKHLSESLSRKVKTKTSSKPVDSDNDAEDDGGPVSPREYLEKRGGFKSNAI